MKYVPCLPAILIPLFLGACSASAPPLQEAAPAVRAMATDIAYETQNATMLLVSLDDGTVIKQTISVDADVCFKQNSQSSTTCLTQGNPIIDPVSNTVIGFEMIEDRIELVAKTN